jgi:glucosylceramidase
MNTITQKTYTGVIALCMAIGGTGTLSAQATPLPEIESWITTADRTALFQKQPGKITFGKENRRGLPIIVDSRQTYQQIDGFGFALTEGSAFHLHRMSPAARKKILEKLFATDGANMGISYIRLTLGASDLNRFVYSYNDLPEGETDYELKKFSLGHDYDDIIPVMKEILAIAPDIRIMASPWSAPAWMKTNGNVRNGSLKKDCYPVYARYFVKYIQAMHKEGIPVGLVTIQNEPLNSRNTPSMPWYYQEHAAFVKGHLGPAFEAAGIDTKIVIFDHNCDRPDYPLAILSDPETARYVDGSAFHHYGGYLSTMSVVHAARPDKNIYFSEQMLTERPGSSTIPIAGPVKRLIIDVTRNWSKNVILWNLAADPLNDPHTDNGGCSMCQGAVTLDGDSAALNVASYTIAHASRFVRPGSYRIASTHPFDMAVDITQDEEREEVRRATVITHSEVLPNAAFRTPEGKTVLIVANNTWSEGTVKIQYNGQFAYDRLPPGAVGTYVW